MKLKLLIATLVLATSGQAFAGNVQLQRLKSLESRGGNGGGHDGNGGDAVVCNQNGKITAELLDFYEARVMRDIQVNLGPAELSVDAKLDIALRRLRKISPERADRYSLLIQNFHNEAHFFSGYNLPDINDSKHVLLPVNCSIKQLVIQRKNPPAGEKKFLVNQDLWILLNNTDRAGILLHEAIYEEALERGATNSIKVRYFNSKISSSIAEIKSPEQARCFFIGQGLDAKDSNSKAFSQCYIKDTSALTLKRPIEFGLGGDVVIGQDGSNKLLEYYEAEQRNNPPSFAGADSYTEILEILLRRLGQQSPDQEAKARQALVEFNADQQSVRGVQLIGPQDSKISLPVELSVKKVILSKAKQFPEDKAFFIQADIWEKLSEETKAGLVFQILLLNTNPPDTYNARDMGAYRQLHSDLAGVSYYRLKFK